MSYDPTESSPQPLNCTIKCKIPVTQRVKALAPYFPESVTSIVSKALDDYVYNNRQRIKDNILDEIGSLHQLIEDIL